jgi:hypothetical protein
MPEQERCYFCGRDVDPSYGNFSDDETIACKSCGTYILPEFTSVMLSKEQIPEAWKISSYIREKTIRKLPTPVLWWKGTPIGPDSPAGSVVLTTIASTFPRTIAERLDRTLLNLEGLSRQPGTRIPLNSRFDGAIAFAENDVAFSFLFSQLKADGYVEWGGSWPGDVVLTVKGWNRVAELQRGGPLSKQVFVAMSFDPSLSDAYENGIKPAIETDCGFVAFRVDQAQHNEDINDKIIAEMLKSKFMVSDFTGHRHGVYFEAGFMLGLGRGVIFSCREGQIGQAHFDTSHRNHIIWKDAADLREKLKTRIQGTIR